MRVCDVCRDPAHQPVDPASLHVRGKSGGALDICADCQAIAAANRSPAKSAAAIARLRPWVPREFSDSDPLTEDQS